MSKKILETERLAVRELSEHDAAFMLELLNEPGWLRFIGDRGIRTLDGAREYLAKGPLKMYRERGFGLYAVEPKHGGEALGVCGLIKRETLADIDIGFAFLARHAKRGYGAESAAAVMDHARRVLGLTRIVAITAVDNDASIRLLQRIGLRFETLLTLPGDDEPVKLFATV